MLLPAPLLSLGMLSLLACTDDAETDDTGTTPEVGVLEVTLSTFARPSFTTGAVTDLVLSLEDASGAVLQEGVTTDGSGLASFEVDWAQGPFAVTLDHADWDAPLVLAGLDQAQAHTVIEWEVLDQAPDTVTVSGAASPRVEDSYFGVSAFAPGAGTPLVWSGGNDEGYQDSFQVAVPAGVPFVLVATQTGWSFEANPPWILDQPIYSTTVVAHDAIDADTTLDLDLTESVPRSEASLSIEQPIQDGLAMENAVAWVKPASSGYGTASGIAVHSEPEDTDGKATIDMAWVLPGGDQDVQTAVKAIAYEGDSSLESRCGLHASPDELASTTIALLPFPSLPETLDLAEPLDLDVPEGAMVHLILTSGLGGARGEIIWPAGAEELRVPAGLLAGLSGTVVVTPTFLDGAYFQREDPLEYCYSTGLSREWQAP